MSDHRFTEEPDVPMSPAPCSKPCALVALLSALSLVTSCSEFSPVETPPNLNARCREEDSDPSTPVSFRRDILEGIFLVDRARAPGCSCHNPADPMPLGFQMTGLDLSSRAAALRGGSGTASSIIVPGRPCASVLFLKVTSTPPLGARMPRNGPPYLSDAQIRLIHDWIAEGALDN